MATHTERYAGATHCVRHDSIPTSWVIRTTWLAGDAREALLAGWMTRLTIAALSLTESYAGPVPRESHAELLIARHIGDCSPVQMITIRIRNVNGAATEPHSRGIRAATYTYRRGHRVSEAAYF
jgi:hypothetical protein